MGNRSLCTRDETKLDSDPAHSSGRSRSRSSERCSNNIIQMGLSPTRVGTRASLELGKQVEVYDFNDEALCSVK